MFLPRHRKTESKLLWWTKIIILFILLSGLIGYIVDLFRLIIIEEPSIEYSYRKLDPLLPPAFRLQVQGNKTLFQCKYTYKKNNFIGDGDCTAYLKIRETYTSTTEINGTIYTNGNVTSYEFVPSNLINITTLFITWYTNGSNEDFISFGQDLRDIGANYPNQITLMNFINYFLADKTLFIKENTENIITYKPSTREYLFRDWTNYLGFPNYYIKLPLLQVTTSVFDNTVDNVVANNHTTILISPYGKVQGDLDMQILETVETEKRHETILGNIGSLGGAISIAAVIHFVLFGGLLCYPWGIIQKCYNYKSRTKRKFLNNLSIIPLSEKTRLPLFEEKNDTSQKEYINYLISRLHSLETILEEYSINSDFIEKLDK
ncbi:hypothetical protein F8M41_020729 [Gigaspora margarita]|uniref:Uncharacterized protein n=1 Tax=Gigaspora margarita TaxID=4874 RepID=A0A8H4ETT7_GIGMA|nr:hypothetical protein F8M41_020729 [Gigaspora margarita]